ncbi:MAG: CoA transferase [Burkholderiaceae bacterium]|nr:CoA transferase [Burkholderiaceae bacterium]
MDLSAVLAGPYCTRILAGLGADVIKIEPPWGDSNRGAEPIKDGRSIYFGILNVGKRSVALDLKTEKDREILVGLIKQADVLVENFRPGVMTRLGLDYASVKQLNPAIVYCSISGYGQDSSKRDRPCTAQIIHAGVGYDSAFMSYQPESGPPPATGLYVADALAGSMAVSGILSALRISERTGTGKHVDIALDESLLSMLIYEVASAQYKPDFDRKGYRPLRTMDSYVMAVETNERTFSGICNTIGRPELALDERFNTKAKRWRNDIELHQIIEEWTTKRSSEECETLFQGNGVPASTYGTVKEYIQDPFLQERKTLIKAKNKDSSFLSTGVPFKIRDELGTLYERTDDMAVPDLGEHTDDVIAELFHMSK